MKRKGVQSGWKEGRMFQEQGGRERYICTGCQMLRVAGARLNTGSLQAGEFRRGRRSVGRCETTKTKRNAAGRTAPEMKNLNQNFGLRGE